MHAVDARLHELACCEWESVRGGINFIHRVRDHQLQRMYLGSDHHALWLLVLHPFSVVCFVFVFSFVFAFVSVRDLRATDLQILPNK